MNNPRNRVPLAAHFATDLIGVEAIIGVDTNLGSNRWTTSFLQIMCSSHHGPEDRLLNSLHWVRDDHDEKLLHTELQRFYHENNVRTHRCKLCHNTSCFRAKQQQKQPNFPGFVNLSSSLPLLSGKKSKQFATKQRGNAQPCSIECKMFLDVFNKRNNAALARRTTWGTNDDSAAPQAETAESALSTDVNGPITQTAVPVASSQSNNDESSLPLLDTDMNGQIAGTTNEDTSLPETTNEDTPLPEVGADIVGETSATATPEAYSGGAPTTTLGKRGGAGITHTSGRKQSKIAPSTITGTPPQTIHELRGLLLENHVGGRLIKTIDKCLHDGRDVPPTVVSASQDLIERIGNTVFDFALLNRDVTAFDVAQLSAEGQKYANGLHAMVGKPNTQQCVHKLTELHENEVRRKLPCRGCITFCCNCILRCADVRWLTTRLKRCVSVGSK